MAATAHFHVIGEDFIFEGRVYFEQFGQEEADLFGSLFVLEAVFLDDLEMRGS